MPQSGGVWRYRMGQRLVEGSLSVEERSFSKAGMKGAAGSCPHAQAAGGVASRPLSAYLLSFLIIASMRVARASEPGCEDITLLLPPNLRNMLAIAAGS